MAFREGASDALGERIKMFLEEFNRCFEAGKASEVRRMYEVEFPRQSDHFFTSARWPSLEVVSRAIPDLNPLFALLYRELYYRHIFTNSKITTPLAVWLESWNAYTELLAKFAEGAFDRSPIPNEWLYEVFDEFVFQFAVHKQTWLDTSKRDEADLAFLGQHPSMWATAHAAAALQALVERPGVADYLAADAAGTASPTPTGAQRIGYFATMAQARLHLLIGDTSTTLRSLRPLVLSRRAAHAKILSCHAAIHHYVAVALLLRGEFAEAGRLLVSVLSFLARANFRARSTATTPTNSALSRRQERMLALLAVATASMPLRRAEDQAARLLREKHQEDLAKMSKGDEEALDTAVELFARGSPRFVPAAAPLGPGAPTGAFATDAHAAHLALFRRALRQHMRAPALVSYLKLYATIALPRLAALANPRELGLPEATGEAESATALRTLLMCAKHKDVRAGQGMVSTGESTVTHEAHFHLDKDIVFVDTPQTAQRHGDYFVRYIHKYEDVVRDLSAGHA